MSRNTTSIIWEPSRNEFQKIINESSTLADVLRYFNLHVGAGNYRTLKKRIKDEGINVAHIPLGLNCNKGRKPEKAIFQITIPLENILVENSTYTHGKNLKQRLFKANLLQNICYECKMPPIWNNKPITLQIDHINGIHNDNRLENLRLLCPNCHSQTDTFNGRNTKIKYRCVDCKTNINKENIRCRKCNSIFMLNKHTKIDWPNDTELLDMLKKHTYVNVGKMLNVSDNAIRKRLKRRKLI